MKRRNLFLILILTLLFSGCNAVYEVNIDGDKINEKLTLVENNMAIVDIKNDSGWSLRETFESLLNKDEFSNKNYSVKSLNTDDSLGIEYKNTSLSSIINSSVLNQCYISPVVNKVDNIITIDTGNDFKCYDYYDNLNEIEIRFKTNHKVLSTNATRAEDGIYIWNLSKNSDKTIQIVYDDSIIYKKNGLYISVAIIGILTVALIVYLIIRKSLKNNKI